MLLAETIARAAKRWLSLLRTSTFPQAWGIIHADARYTDLTKTQYSAALDWLHAHDFLMADDNGFKLNSKLKLLPLPQTNRLLFERILETSEVPWLPDADILIPDASELPQDAASIGTMLGLTDESAFLAVRQIHGRIDLARRAMIGGAGEKALFTYLEHHWPGATTHVALSNDGFGYDLAFFYAGIEWHLEVKSTVRRGRITVYMSRHEFETGASDPNWRLVVVELSSDLNMYSFATAPFDALKRCAPQDVSLHSKWQSASFQLASDELVGGLDFLGGGQEADRYKYFRDKSLPVHITASLATC